MKIALSLYLFTFGGLAIGGLWQEYPLYLPAGVNHINEISVNAHGNGFTIPIGPGVIGPTLGLVPGAWAYYPPPPKEVAYLSTAAESNCVYAVDGGTSPELLWRFRPPATWEVAGNATMWGFDFFTGCAGITNTSWWATADGGPGGKDDGVVYFEHGKPAQVWTFGDTGYPSHFIVTPRGANPTGEAYALMMVKDSSPYSSYQWCLFVLEPGGEYTRHIVPTTGYNADGLTAYTFGEVRFMMTPPGGGSRLYKFYNGVFTLIQTFPERVVLQCYPSLTEGWGTTYSSKVYHWTDGGFSESETLPGTVKDLDFVSVNDGWAVGFAGSGSNMAPKLWHYTSSGANVVPTSLGRVKAAFK